MGWVTTTLAHGKTYVAALGLIGLAVYQLSQGDFMNALPNIIAIATMLKLRIDQGGPMPTIPAAKGKIMLLPFAALLLAICVAGCSKGTPEKSPEQTAARSADCMCGKSCWCRNCQCGEALMVDGEVTFKEVVGRQYSRPDSEPILRVEVKTKNEIYHRFEIEDAQQFANLARGQKVKASFKNQNGSWHPWEIAATDFKKMPGCCCGAKKPPQ